jgi:hypothetical protein
VKLLHKLQQFERICDFVQYRCRTRGSLAKLDELQDEVYGCAVECVTDIAWSRPWILTRTRSWEAAGDHVASSVREHPEGFILDRILRHEAVADSAINITRYWVIWAWNMGCKLPITRICSQLPVARTPIDALNHLGDVGRKMRQTGVERMVTAFVRGHVWG